jgi:hypothetical protein
VLSAQFRIRQVAQRSKELIKQGHTSEDATARAEETVQALLDEKLRTEEEDRPWLFKGQGVLEELTVRTYLNPDKQTCIIFRCRLSAKIYVCMVLHWQASIHLV